MDLGWMMPCFDVADLPRSMAFYEQLGFRRVGGNPEQAWAIMANGPMELGLYSGHFNGWMLNFRGGNAPQLTARFHELGQNVTQESSYSPEQWPEAEQTFNGQPLPYTESGDCTILDPEGRVLYFDTYPIERIRFKRGDAYATDSYDGSYIEGQPRLGKWCIELYAVDPQVAEEFYRRIGLDVDNGVATDGSQSWSLLILPGSGEVVFTAINGTAYSVSAEDSDGYQFAIRP